MNCQSCNTTIDYRFLTNCAQCETEHADLHPGVLIQAPIESEHRRNWIRPLINFTYILISSGGGMVSGAVVLFFGAVVICNAFLSSSGDPGHDCARGNLIGFLTIFTGAFLGTIGGSVFAVKNPICKN